MTKRHSSASCFENSFQLVLRNDEASKTNNIPTISPTSQHPSFGTFYKVEMKNPDD